MAADASEPGVFSVEEVLVVHHDALRKAPPHNDNNSNNSNNNDNNDT